MAPLRIAVVVVAYNAEATLREVLDRIPAGFVPRISSVLVCDDASTDGTHDVVVQYQSTSSLPITVIRHPVNLGYGGNQKHGYQWAIDNGMDAVVLLHGDGQYAPERLEEVVAPLDRGEADAVLASRMMRRLDALRGGMPLYKFAGNIAGLTRIGASVSIAAAFLSAAFALAPNIYVAVAVNCVISAALAMLAPAIFTGLSLAIPPRARATGYSVASLWIIPGLAVLPMIG